MELVPAEEHEGFLLDRGDPVGLHPERLAEDGGDRPCGLVGARTRDAMQALDVTPAAGSRAGADANPAPVPAGSNAMNSPAPMSSKP